MRRVTKLTIALALCLVAALAPTGVQAQALEPVVEEHLDDVGQAYQRLSGDATAACSQACDDIVSDAARAPTAAQDPVGARLIESFTDTTQSPVKEPWRKPWSGTTLGRGGLAGILVAANYYVWKVHVIGPLEATYFVSVPKRPIDDGYRFLLTLGDQYQYRPGPNGERPDPLPVGLVAINDSTWTVMSSTIGPEATPWCRGENWGPQIPPELEEFTWTANSCEGTPMTGQGWQVPLSVALRTRLDLEPGQDPPTIDNVTGDPLTPAQARQRIEDHLRSGNEDYELLGTWLCAVLGGPCENPKDDHPTTPDCTGMTASACTQAFQDAGFTGTITTEQLSADTAVMEQAAGKVTATYPHGGIEIAKPRAIRIYVNPDPMPAPTTQVATLADTLEAQNPDVVDASNKLTIARTCIGDMQHAGRSASDCTSLPIMVVGNDQETPARNALQGLLRNPAWAVLVRRDSRGLSRNGWYENKGEPTPGCLGTERVPVMAQCDEYPFFSTLEGHGGPLSTPGLESSIRWVPLEEHKTQAKMIRQFYSDNNPGSVMGFHGCGIARQPLVGAGPELSESSFIVLPIPFSSGIRSTGVCNRLPDPNPAEDPDPAPNEEL
jgi:hypothetical protein